MTDKGRKLTDKELHKLERRLVNEYDADGKKLEKKIRLRLLMFDALDKKNQRLVDKGKMSKESYETWRKNELSNGRWMHRLIDDIAKDMLERNRKSADRINESAEKVYLQNHNNSMKDVERSCGTSIDHKIFKRSTVRRLKEENPNALPKASINETKDLRWNKQKLTSMLHQSVANGEKARDIAKRFSDIVRMNKISAIRSARTMITGAENSAILAALKIAKFSGVPIKKKWVAKLDERTRASHKGINGEIRELGEAFSNGLMYPGDSSGEAREIFNCRCKIVAVIEGNADKSSTG